MPTKFKAMDKNLLVHYIVHAVHHDQAWLDDRRQKKVDHIAKMNTIMDGGEVQDDEKGPLQWDGIQNWKYDEVDPNTGIPWADRFETEDEFEVFKDSQVEAVKDKIKEEERRQTNYDDIIETKDHINNGKIIVCKTVKDQDDAAGVNDRKVKVKSGRQNFLVVVKNGI